MSFQFGNRGDAPMVRSIDNMEVDMLRNPDFTPHIPRALFRILWMHRILAMLCFRLSLVTNNARKSGMPCGPFPISNAMVVRLIPAGTAEYSIELCQRLYDSEVKRPRGINCWLENTIHEWQSVVQDPGFDEAMCGRFSAMM